MSDKKPWTWSQQFCDFSDYSESADFLFGSFILIAFIKYVCLKTISI